MRPVPVQAYAIPIADAIARGHVDCGVSLYNQFAQSQTETQCIHTDIRLIAPAATNLALGFELLLKLHWCQYTGTYPKGHDINQLGKLFSVMSRRVV